MFSRLIHDSLFGASLVHNALLIALILIKTPRYLRSYAIVLFYLSVVEILMAISSLLIYRKVMSTSSYSIIAVCGICRHWGSPTLCSAIDAIQFAGTAHHPVLIALCFCYRYYVIASSRSEPDRKNVLIVLFSIHLPSVVVYSFYFARTLLEGEELTRAMNESHPHYSLNWKENDEMLLVSRQDLSIYIAAWWIQGIILPVSLVVVITSVRIHMILASVDHMSSRNKTRHRLILRGLLCQAVMPALFAVLVGIYLAEREKTINGSEDIGNLLAIISSFLIAISPLLTIYFTLPYREALLSIFSDNVGVPNSLSARQISADKAVTV